MRTMCINNVWQRAYSFAAATSARLDVWVAAQQECGRLSEAFSWVSFSLGHRPLSLCILHGLTLIKIHNNAAVKMRLLEVN